MPGPTIKEALAEAYASAPSDVVALSTLEFRHPAFSTPIRVVRNTVNITATLEPTAPIDAGVAVEFTAYAFEMELPEIDEKAAPQISVMIDNVSREIVRNLELAAGQPDLIWMTYRPYLSNDLTSPSMDPVMHFVIKEISCDIFRVRAVAGFGEFANRQFPGETYTAVRFPGLLS